MKVKLGDYVLMVQEREVLKKVDTSKYVSTENILADRNGVKFPANTIPLSKTITTYKKDDILISNIRPYFKKIWKAEFDGPKSNDVIAFRTKDSRLLQDYLYVVLQSDNFFNYVTNTAKGTKMPRGDKRAIINYEFELPNIQLQRKISHTILVLEKKIRLNNQINDNLATLKTSIFDKLFKNKMSSHLNGNLSNITIITSGKRPKKKFDNKSSVAKYPIVGASKIMGYTDRYLYNESILTTGRVGTHGVIQRFRKPVWVSDNSFVFKTEHEDYLFEILNNWIKYSALNRGSTQPLITQTDLKNIDIYVPTKEEFYHFESVVTPLTDQQFSLISENDNLKKAKAALLSKLF